MNLDNYYYWQCTRIVIAAKYLMTITFGHGPLRYETSFKRANVDLVL